MGQKRLSLKEWALPRRLPIRQARGLTKHTIPSLLPAPPPPPHLLPVLALRRSAGIGTCCAIILTVASTSWVKA